MGNDTKITEQTTTAQKSLVETLSNSIKENIINLQKELDMMRESRRSQMYDIKATMSVLTCRL